MTYAPSPHLSPNYPCTLSRISPPKEAHQMEEPPESPPNGALNGALPSGTGEPFLLTFLLMFTILAILFIAWRAKRLVSILLAGTITTLICVWLPLKITCQSNYKDCLDFFTTQLHLKIFTLLFLPICLLFRLFLRNWLFYLCGFTLLGSPWVAVFGLVQYLDTLLVLQSIDSTFDSFQAVQLSLYCAILTLFGAIWAFLFTVQIIKERQLWIQWKAANLMKKDTLIGSDLESGTGTSSSSLSPSPEPSLLFRERERKSTFTKSHTTTRLVKFSHQWSIDEFIRCDHRREAPKFLDSTVFSSPDNEEMRFFLRLYPRGRSQIGPNSGGRPGGESALSLYLHWIPSESLKEVTIGFVISLINKGGEKCDLHERRDLFSSIADSHGWDTFIYRSSLLNSRFLLPAEKLTIHCEVSYAVEEIRTFETIV